MLKLTVLFLALSFAAGCAVVSPAAPAEPSGRIVGEVVWAADRPGARPYPSPGVAVQARPRYRGGLLRLFQWQAGRPVAEAVTDSLGRYALRVRPGAYLVTALHRTGNGGGNCYLIGYSADGLTEADRVGAAAAVEVARGQAVERDLVLSGGCFE